MRSSLLLAHLSAFTNVLGASIQQPLSSNHLGVQSQDDRQNPQRQIDIPQPLDDMVKALSAMQDNYYDLLAGTWPDSIDWTAAVMGTHVSATLSSLITGLTRAQSDAHGMSCGDLMGWDNIVNQYFAQISIFYFGENALGLRNQANDDMLWVVLGWLENIKFADMYTTKQTNSSIADGTRWHGVQFAPLAAHRARIFYDLASKGWDEDLCGGGMIWNSALKPYKNSITNELFAAASIAMYLYYPGDNSTAPFKVAGDSMQPHDPAHLGYAIKSYKWLRDVGLTGDNGLYQDGYHISGWHKYRNGTIDPGSRVCDSLDTMVYTYNQGVLLSASRGLWLATGKGEYLDDGHQLIQSVIKATGWPRQDRYWKGLGRGGILEEYCDSGVSCSQDGQTFKGIFFHHLADFCRPLTPREADMAASLTSNSGFDPHVYEKHLMQCGRYGKWIEHNANAALMTRNDDGLFGMWWGIPSRPSDEFVFTQGSQKLPDGATDWKNPPMRSNGDFHARDYNDRGRGRTVETQSGGLAVMRARWQWHSVYGR